MEKFEWIDGISGILSFIYITMIFNIFFAFGSIIVYLLMYLIPIHKNMRWL